MIGNPDPVIRAFGSLAAAEARLAELTHCAACEQLLYQETLYRRAYALPGVVALVVLCESCNDLVVPNSAVDRQFAQRLLGTCAADAKAGRNFHLVIPTAG